MIELSEVNRLQILNELLNSISNILENGEHSDSIHEKVSQHVKAIEYLLGLEEIQTSGEDLTTIQAKIDQANSFINQ
jgi:hypothetical protein